MVPFYPALALYLDSTGTGDFETSGTTDTQVTITVTSSGVTILYTRPAAGNAPDLAIGETDDDGIVAWPELPERHLENVGWSLREQNGRLAKTAIVPRVRRWTFRNRATFD